MALKLAYETWGEGPHPLLLVHGFTGNRTSFDHLRALWSPHVKAIVIELPGLSDTTTEIKAAPDFYYAEDYHQQYLDKNPFGYCPVHATGVTCN